MRFIGAGRDENSKFFIRNQFRRLFVACSILLLQCPFSLRGEK